MLRSLFHGLYEVLDVPVRVSLRVLVQLLGSPLGLLAGREARYLALTIERPRFKIVSGRIEDGPTSALTTVQFPLIIALGSSVNRDDPPLAFFFTRSPF